MLAAVLLPLVLWPLYTKTPVRSTLVSVLLLILCTLPFMTALTAFLDPREPSNAIKLNLLVDYERMLSDPATLLFGRGLSAYAFWSARGRDFYISELTYLEMVRNFGLIGAAVMAVLLVTPVVFAFASGPVRERALAVAYALYLLTCATNPNLFSSMGILILAVLVANLVTNRARLWEPTG